MKKIILLLFILLITVLTQAQVSKTINLATAGTLSTSLTATEKNTVTNLTIMGVVDARDFKIMRDSMSKLAILDISNVTVLAYNGYQGTGYQGYESNVYLNYPANEIPQYSFCNVYIGRKLTLSNIILPNSVNSIGAFAFSFCNGLTSLTIPNTVATIRDCAFEACSGLTSLFIPNSVSSICNNTFANCQRLTEFVVQTDNPNYSSINGVLFNKNQTYLIEYPCGKNGIYTIPNSVTSIQDNSFYNCTGLTSISIPSSVTSIGNYAFFYCTGLISISISSSVTSIGYDSFEGCAGLTSINTPTSLTSLSSGIFSNCTGLTSITIASSVTSIDGYTFYRCTGLTSINIPSSVNSIGEEAFYGCIGLTSIYANSTLPIDLSSSGSVFYNVNKTTCTLYVPAGSKSAYQKAVQWKDFTNIVETTTDVPTITNAAINVYPNPTAEYFQVSGFDGTALISLRNLNGKAILTKLITATENVSVSSLPKGIYVLEVSTNDGTVEKKIVKN